LFVESGQNGSCDFEFIEALPVVLEQYPQIGVTANSMPALERTEECLRMIGTDGNRVDQKIHQLSG